MIYPNTFSMIGFYGPLLALVVAFIGWKKSSANTIFQIVLAVGGFIGFLGAITQLVDAQNTISGIFLAVLNLGIVVTSLYAISYLPRYKKQYALHWLNITTAIFIFGMQGVLVANTVLSFLLFWEIMSVSAYALVIADQQSLSVKAGQIYMVMTQIGFFSLLAGFALITQGNYNVEWGLLRGISESLSPAFKTAAFLLLFLGFGAKAGLIPFHQWLPHAHPQAPSHSSALMSGTMLNVAIFGFLKVFLGVFWPVPSWWAVTIICIGLISAIYGVLCAITESNLKKILAWSSIENMGLIFSAIGFSLWFGNDQYLLSILFLTAALVHIVNHSLFKIGWFLSAGTIISETHTGELDELGGLANRFPLFSVFALGLLFSAAALPPLGTFFGEWLYLQTLGMALSQTSIDGSIGIMIAIGGLALVSGGAVMAFVRIFSTVFLSRPRSEHVAHSKRLPPFLVWPIGLVVVISLFLGIGAGVFQQNIRNIASDTIGYNQIGYANSLIAERTPSLNFMLPVVANSATSHVELNQILFFVLIFCAFIIPALMYFFIKRKNAIRITNTWDCGQPITARMTTNATGFSAPIRFFFKQVLLPYKRITNEPVISTNKWILKKSIDSSTESIWEKYLYAPIVDLIGHVSCRVKRWQSGSMQRYILFMFLTLIIVLFLSL